MLSILEEQEIGFAMGVADYLTKPVDRHRLSAILDRFRGDDQPGAVLVVEDDPAARDTLRHSLEREGWHVELAENGRIGLERVAQQIPELILLDLMMPVMDGFEFVYRLREHGEWRSIPIVVITAKDLTEEDRQKLNGYVEGILQKDASSPEKLLLEVRDIMAASIG